MRNHMDMSTSVTPRTPASPRPLGRATGALLPDELALGAVHLRVRDLARSRTFYEHVLGLRAAPASAPGALVLGSGDGAPVVVLEERPDAEPHGRTAGLYHVALRYPQREQLARAIHRIASLQVPIDGASDHGTHEALYLPDPDGNGLELAVDRPADAWPDLADIEAIAPRPLDVEDLLATIVDEDASELSAPAHGVRVGHVHLHVGDIEQALRFYVDALGFELVTLIDSAAFASAGGYHHHLAVNTWRGRGAPAPGDDRLGLASWSIELPDRGDVDALAARLAGAGHAHERVEAGDGLRTRDPWGIALDVRVAGAAQNATD
jgi:catechol 2,3-dioxygenase